MCAQANKAHAYIRMTVNTFVVDYSMPQREEQEEMG